MKRRIDIVMRRFIKVACAALTVALILLTPAGAADAQQPEKVYRIGWLSGTSAAGHSDIIPAFREALRQLGYVEGKSIVIEYRFADGRTERLPTLAAEMLSLNVDVLVTAGTPVTSAAKQATTAVPIIMLIVANPVETGLVASLAKPGGNVTGVSGAYGDFAPKWLELLRELAPSASRIGYLNNPSNPSTAAFLKHLLAAGRTLGVTVQVFAATKPEEVEPQLAAMAKAQVQALIVAPDAVLRTKRQQTVEFAARARLPGMYGGGDYVENGGLMSYSPDRPEMARQAAAYVAKILRGAKPADLPVEQPTKFELVINRKAANALGITIPQSVLLRADRVIE